MPAHRKLAEAAEAERLTRKDPSGQAAGLPADERYSDHQDPAAVVIAGSIESKGGAVPAGARR